MEVDDQNGELESDLTDDGKDHRSHFLEFILTCLAVSAVHRVVQAGLYLVPVHGSTLRVPRGELPAAIDLLAPVPALMR